MLLNLTHFRVLIRESISHPDLLSIPPDYIWTRTRTRGENRAFPNAVTAGCEFVSFSHTVLTKVIVNRYPGVNKVRHFNGSDQMRTRFCIDRYWPQPDVQRAGKSLLLGRISAEALSGDPVIMLSSGEPVSE